MLSKIAERGKSIDAAELRRMASGRWPEIIPDMCLIAPSILNGRHHPCPKCGGRDRFRAFDDFAQTGGVICNQCHSERNGDGLATVAWMLDSDFPTACRGLADYLGIGGNGRVSGHHQGNGRPNIVEEIARRKRVPLESWLGFGAHESHRGKMLVCRLPMFDQHGSECSHFDFSTKSEDWLKGLAAKNKPVGLFLNGGIVPTAGQTIHVVEGPKDAAALDALGLNAVGLPTSAMHEKFTRLFRGVNVIVIPDRDEAGEAGVNRTAGRLAGVAASVRIATLPGELKVSGGDDVRDVLVKRNGEELLRQTITDAVDWKPEPDPTANIIESIDDPHRLARVVLEKSAPIKFWQDEFLTWGGISWRVISQAALTAAITRIVREDFERIASELASRQPQGEPAVRIRKVTQSIRSNVRETIKSLVILPYDITMPTWLGDSCEYAAHDCLVLQNGILPLPSLNAKPVLYDLTPNLFTTNALDFDFDPNAQCPEWKNFLHTLWPDDLDTISTLQEMFG